VRHADITPYRDMAEANVRHKLSTSSEMGKRWKASTIPLGKFLVLLKAICIEAMEMPYISLLQHPTRRQQKDCRWSYNVRTFSLGQGGGSIRSRKGELALFELFESKSLYDLARIENVMFRR